MERDGSDEAKGRAREVRTDVSAVLSLSIRAARLNVTACATLLANAGAALHDGSETIAMDHVLDVEPLLFEAQTILNAASILRRKAREDAFEGA